ncbi:BMP family lipoprotein [Lacisediminihabitans changchengi]|uniref:BMP family ABC transporter substrate-binding protein n=1 Tax=Lacisediminihabitans changchengi TaxID=2787634 RepID=A0A934STU1_9MICO|nr:BMP family ABC transporter substrate-binding protein [Lacisediminihabitans changchengi]MBK4348863.1 BMP family ABC transporter substrate-binding protein [Lacisediminihabitans changchengi]
MRITTRRAVFSGLAMVGIAAVLAGCASAPAKSSSSGSASKFLPCMVSDAGGFDDKSFNQLGLEGLQSAAKSLGTTFKKAESNADTDYAPNIDGLVSAGCNLIITVGFNLSAATITAAKANPTIQFAIIDDAADANFDGKTDEPNIKPILFDTAQAAYLAGYASASYSKTGIVGTFGGQQFPTVTIFMDGFADGVAGYNKAKSKDVKVVGWDVASQKGSFTGGFEANDTAKNTAQNLIDQNADVIFPVGGPIFQSAGAAITDSKKDIALLGADADVFDTFPTYDKLYLTSVLKGIDPAVQDVVKATAKQKKGTFDDTAYVGTLKNNGVGIAPFHDFKDKVSPDLQGELDKLKSGIIDGSITVKSYLSGS